MSSSCNTAGGALRLWPFGLLYLCPAARRGAGLQCSERHDERTTRGRGFGGVEALPAFSCPRFAPFVPMIRPLVSTFWRFRTYEKGGRLVFTIRRGEYRYKPAAPAFGRGRGLPAFSISGGRLLLSLYHLRGAACFCTRQSLNTPPLVLCPLTAFHYLCR